jgi:archaellum component FlaC
MDMTDSSETTSVDLATLQEITEMIAELEQYRERLVSDTLAMAQRAKIVKSKALETLEPNLAQIDAQLASLRAQQAKLT